MPYPQSYALHALDASDEFLDGIIELDIFVAFFADLVVSMDDRRMVTAAETAANLGQGSIGELTAQIHGDLPRESQIARALLGVQVIDFYFEVRSYDFLDELERDFLCLGRREYIFQGFRYEIRGNRLFGEGGIGYDTGQRAFQLTDIVVDTACDVDHHIIRYVEVLQKRFFLQDGNTRFEVRSLDIGDESPFEAGTQAVLQCLDLTRMTVA